MVSLHAFENCAPAIACRAWSEIRNVQGTSGFEKAETATWKGWYYSTLPCNDYPRAHTLVFSREMNCKCIGKRDDLEFHVDVDIAHSPHQAMNRTGILVSSVWTIGSCAKTPCLMWFPSDELAFVDILFSPPEHNILCITARQWYEMVLHINETLWAMISSPSFCPGCMDSIISYIYQFY